MSSDPQLRRWYAAYRKRYFTNKLPLASEVEIYYDDMPKLHGECNSDDDAPEMDDYRIRIDKLWADHPDIAKMILLHEMAHMHIFPYEAHGEPFQQEMLRLATSGALKGLW